MAGSIARGGTWCRRAVLCAVVLAIGCAGSRESGTRIEPAGETECRSIDSLFAQSGWRSPMPLSGRVKLDVKQYRVQGRFRAQFTGSGDFTFEFAGTMVMGGHHEDVVVSLQGGQLFVLDRERGRFYEGEETDDLIREGLGTDWEMVDVVRRITAWPPPCPRLSRVGIESGGGEAVVEGRVDGEPFRAEFEGRRIHKASWPLTAAGRADDRLSVEYRWRPAPGGKPALERLVAWVEGRRWRMVLDADE